MRTSGHPDFQEAEKESRLGVALLQRADDPGHRFSENLLESPRFFLALLAERIRTLVEVKRANV